MLLRCHSLTLSKKCLRLRLAPSKCLSERMNRIISKIPHRISKILFVYGYYEFLAMREGKVREAPFFKVQSGKITVWIYYSVILCYCFGLMVCQLGEKEKLNQEVGCNYLWVFNNFILCNADQRYKICTTVF